MPALQLAETQQRLAQCCGQCYWGYRTPAGLDVVAAALLALGQVWMQSHVCLGKQTLLPLGVGRAGRTPLQGGDLEEGKKSPGGTPCPSEVGGYIDGGKSLPGAVSSL